MDDDEDWGPALIMQTTEDVARAVVAVAAAASAVTAPRSPRPSVVFSTKDEGGNQLQKLQNQVTRVIKGLKHPPEVKIGGYNPEVLTTLKRQWTSIQMRSLDHRIWKEPSRLFESMVVVGIHPNCDIQALQQQYIGRKSEGSGRFRTVLGGGQHQLRVEPNLKPQVLFVYPPEKQLPLKYKDLLSFCFPAGVEVHAIEKNPSKSELNEILIGQEHLKQSDLSFVFRLQVADDSTLYGCCVLVDELIQNPSGLISMISDGQPPRLPLSRHILTTRRCYCILSRVPCFELHFGVLNSIFTEERLERLTKSISESGLDGQEENLEEVSSSISPTNRKEGTLNGIIETSQSSTTDSIPGKVLDGKCHLEHQKLEKRVDDNVVPTDPKTEESPAEKETLVAAQISKTCDTFVDNVVPVDPKTEDLPAEKESLVGSQISNACDTFVDTVVAIDPKTEDLTAEKESLVPSQISEACDTSFDNVVPIDPKTEAVPDEKESLVAAHISKACDTFVEDVAANKQSSQWRSPNTVLPLLRHQQHESSDSSSSFQGSPEDRNSRCDAHEAEIEEASFSGQSSDHGDILEWAKANGHGSLQIISEYYQLRCPERGSKIKFHPLEHLHPLEFHRPDETVLHVAGSTIELKYCRTSLEMAEAHNALMAEEEATALSVWAVACLCGSFRLEHVLTLFAGALLEKKIVVVCSNLGVLSACVLSIIPLIRPYQWQSFLMPVLPNDMLDFLDAPVPYIVGVKNKAAEFQSMLTNVVLVDANKNQVKSSRIPQLPRQKELFSSLSPYHAKLVGESYLGRKRPIHACTDVQVEAAKGFLAVLRSYLDSLCSNMRSHTITNVQSNDDKVSLLLKESFIESFPSHDRPFMKLFLDTQLFSVHTDLVLSFFQKD